MSAPSARIRCAWDSFGVTKGHLTLWLRCGFLPMAHGWLRYPLAVKWLRKLCERWNVQHAETYRNEIAWKGWYKYVQVHSSPRHTSINVSWLNLQAQVTISWTSPPHIRLQNSYDRSFLPASWFFLHWLLTRGLMTIESTGLKQWNTLGHRVVTEFSALNFHQIDSPLFATAHPLPGASEQARLQSH